MLTFQTFLGNIAVTTKLLTLLFLDGRFVKTLRLVCGVFLFLFMWIPAYGWVLAEGECWDIRFFIVFSGRLALSRSDVSDSFVYIHVEYIHEKGLFYLLRS